MSRMSEEIRFSDQGTGFSSERAAFLREIYLPLSAPDGLGVKSAITPYLSGDIKIDQSCYLTKPVSRQDLRYPLRNFFIRTQDGDVFALTSREPGADVRVEAGQLWHRVVNRSRRLNLDLEVLNFVPVSGGDVELMRVTVRNAADHPVVIRGFGCVPVFGRPLANKHDHEHVTSLLQRIRQIPQGILVEPTMVFNEEGHREADRCYFVFGCDASGALPQGSFPTVDSFLGASGTWESPEAVLSGIGPGMLSREEIDGKECAGAVCFQETAIPPGQAREYLVMIGTARTEQDALAVFQHFCTSEQVERALAECRAFWEEKSGAIRFTTADQRFDAWMRWVTLQPVLRRIFGCSFLPDHDYGKGGKGWRDIWQDLLSLILIEPQGIRAALIGNFAGVRVDGTNATIIGARPGEFVADRNAITRVWMDHGAWPVLTLMLYIDQTGDTEILFERAGYFRDARLSRTFRRDRGWQASDGSFLRTRTGEPYTGTVLEHLLVQTLTMFFNVGEHNLLRLESADWNDGLDMAFERGESAAFSSLYALCLNQIADLLEGMRERGRLERVDVLRELTVLMDAQEKPPCDYDDVRQKRSLLFDTYFPAVEPALSGETVTLDSAALIADLRRKADWLLGRIRSGEIVSAARDGKTYRWFNGYYDNQGRQVEGDEGGLVRMTLTGQVFAVMSGAADQDMVRDAAASVNAFLTDSRGGVRLNTDFGVRNYLDLGRAFSFAYGTKENGAVFSHMAVMYACALYTRGFAREGFQVLDGLYRMASDFECSQMYPNLPEYFDLQGRGMYAYLTGSASWMVLTLVTQAFGVRGWRGDLVIHPKLVREQFAPDGSAVVRSCFAGCPLTVRYDNPKRLDFGSYAVGAVMVNGHAVEAGRLADGFVRLSRAVVEQAAGPVDIRVLLTETAV